MRQLKIQEVSFRREKMLASMDMIGFLLTKDYEKARSFYEGNLGFEFVSLDQFALVMQAGKSMIRIVKDPTFTPLRSTVLGWKVDDIEGMVDWLTKRGVVFDKYPFVQDKERGIWTAPGGSKVAWFRDPDGNVLGVSEHH
jgi:catechol 2,3-dioxygenase-like lactoylglutathione lyase family enzyme